MAWSDARKEVIDRVTEKEEETRSQTSAEKLKKLL
jgi:hypothetical protein